MSDLIYKKFEKIINFREARFIRASLFDVVYPIYLDVFIRFIFPAFRFPCA